MANFDLLPQRNSMRRWWLVLCLGLMCFPLAAQSQPPSSEGESDQFESPVTQTNPNAESEDKQGDREVRIVSEQRLASVFLGRLEPEEKGIFRLRVENPFDVALTCLTLERSCQCSNAKMVAAKSIAPKESLDIELTVDGKGKNGPAGAELYFQLAETMSLDSEEGAINIYRMIQPFTFWVSGDGGFAASSVEIELDPELNRPAQFAGFNFSKRAWFKVMAEVVLPGSDENWRIDGVLSEHKVQDLPSQRAIFEIPDSLRERILASEVQGSVDLFASADDERLLKKVASARFMGRRVEVLRIVPPVLTVDASSETTTFHVISPTNTIKLTEATIEISVEHDGNENLTDLKIVPKQDGWVTVTASNDKLASVASKPLVLVVGFENGTHYRLPLKVWSSPRKVDSESG